MSSDTHVIGSSPKRDAKGQPIYEVAMPLVRCDGKVVGSGLIRATPAWNTGNPVEIALHWVNEAAKRRCNGDKKLAKTCELIQVPIYRGIPASLVTSVRAAKKRSKIRALMKSIRDRIQQVQEPAQ